MAIEAMILTFVLSMPGYFLVILVSIKEAVIKKTIAAGNHGAMERPKFSKSMSGGDIVEQSIAEKYHNMAEKA